MGVVRAGVLGKATGVSLPQMANCHVPRATWSVGEGGSRNCRQEDIESLTADFARLRSSIAAELRRVTPRDDNPAGPRFSRRPATMDRRRLFRCHRRL